MKNIDYLKLTLLVLVAAYGTACALHPENYGFMDGVDLLFHEAGHPIFGLFGNEFLMILGGTLGQLIMPSIIIGYFIWSGQRFSASVTGVWLAQNLFNISVYAKDASAMELPLVGNGDRAHDWNYMLTELDMLGSDQAVGGAIRAAGVIVLIVAVLAGLYFSRKPAEDA